MRKILLGLTMFMLTIGSIFAFNYQTQPENIVTSRNMPSNGLQKVLQGSVGETSNQNREPITIRSNSDISELGFKGTGTQEDPYLIENLNIISSAERLLDIQDTDVYITIRNNHFNGLDESWYGVLLANTSKITLSGNVIENSVYHGILVNLGQKISVLNNWIGFDGGSGILIHDSQDIIINGNIIFENGNHGIWFRSDVSTSQVENNTIRDNGKYGMLLAMDTRMNFLMQQTILLRKTVFSIIT